ncbi:MAG: cache domain-containing protein [Coriobacteriales bacterium]
MKSTKNSLVTLIVLGIVIASLSIGTIAVASFRNVAEENNHEILLHYCKESTELLNGRLAQIEGLVDTLSECCAHRAGSAAKLQDSAFLEACVEEVGQVAYYITQNNDAIVTAYFRVDPAIAGPRAGFFISRNSAAEKPEFLELTDLSAFDPSDVQNVGWYYIPVEAGQAVWLDPYVNPRNGVLTISYAKPLYLDGVLAGVVGIDLDFGVIGKAVDEVSLFDSGFAVLMDSRGLAYTGTHELAVPASAADQITSEQDEYLFSQFLERQQLYVTASRTSTTACTSRSSCRRQSSTARETSSPSRCSWWPSR